MGLDRTVNEGLPLAPSKRSPNHWETTLTHGTAWFNAGTKVINHGQQKNIKTAGFPFWNPSYNKP